MPIKHNSRNSSINYICSMFELILNFFEKTPPILGALYATLFTWGLTALGASFVFLFKKMNRAVLDGMLGFTGGVMVAASFWSLLAPGIDMSPGEGFVKVIPAAVGFSFGALFIFGLDKVLPHLHINFKESEGIKTPWHRTTLMVLAITLHNIPEGLAVGVLFGGVAAGLPEASIASAVILAIGIGIQNFPEGIAVSMPMRRLGLSRRKSFFLRAGLCCCRTYSCCNRCFCRYFFHAYFTLCTCLCSWCHDFCCSGGGNSRNPTGQIHRYCGLGLYWWFYSNDDARRSAWRLVTTTAFCIAPSLFFSWTKTLN